MFQGLLALSLPYYSNLRGTTAIHSSFNGEAVKIAAR